uniref:Uncharacterized protein n=1 Tax=Amorphochlora amoebiformis TaxID=1561963 RepID=A0A0H5BLJ1_9EUKA|nr:hypothetical protein [Amorphochlora amoebiformis]
MKPNKFREQKLYNLSLSRKKYLRLHKIIKENIKFKVIKKEKIKNAKLSLLVNDINTQVDTRIKSKKKLSTSNSLKRFIMLHQSLERNFFRFYKSNKIFYIDRIIAKQSRKYIIKQKLFKVKQNSKNLKKNAKEYLLNLNNIKTIIN